MSKRILYKDYRFNSQRQRMSPFPNYFSMESMCKEMKKYVGEKLESVLLFFEGNIFYAFSDKHSFVRVGKNLTKKIIKDPRFVAKMIRWQKTFGQKLVNFTKKARALTTAKSSNLSLYQMFRTYEKLYKDVYATYGWVWIAEDVYMAELLKIVQAKCGGDANRAVDILNVLTKEEKAMVALQERLAFLQMAVKINNKKGWQGNKAMVALIKKHVKKYFWVTRDYEDPVLTEESVAARLKEAFKKNYKKEYDQLVRSLAKEQALKKSYLSNLNFSPKEKALFAAMRDIAYLKELRKTHVSQSLYYFDRVLEEIGRRLFLSIKQVRFLKTEDAKAGLLKKIDLSQTLNERMKLSLWICRGTGTEVVIGQQAKTLFAEFCQVDKKAKEFFGLPVSPGLARGPARIILNPNESGKVKKGDIIVTIQLVPSFSTAIIKSAGIICDGGHGITSHPATLAREAGIPCVIQTRFARHVLKDGDLVEVDGYKGVARKL